MTKKIAKKDLAELLAEKHGLTKKEATEVVNETFEEIAAKLKKGYEVDINGFGKFVVKKRKARKGINPATKEEIKIAATKVPAFKPSKTLKDEFK